MSAINLNGMNRYKSTGLSSATNTVTENWFSYTGKMPKIKN